MYTDPTRHGSVYQRADVESISNPPPSMKTIPHKTIEDVKTFWNNRPCNIRHSTAQIGTRQYFDEVEQRKYFVEPHIPGFAEFEKWKGKKVLEIGCGIGTDAVNFARAGADYTGIEVSEESLELAKKRFEIFGLQGTFYLGNAEQLSSIVPVQNYDLIYSFGVIHHTPSPEAVVRQVKKYMNATSEFRLMLYAKNSWKDCMIEGGFDQPEAATGCPIAKTFTHKEVKELLKDFDILSLEQNHIFPYIIEKYIRYEYECQPWFQAMPEAMFRVLERRFGWHILIRCRLSL